MKTKRLSQRVPRHLASILKALALRCDRPCSEVHRACIYLGAVNYMTNPYLVDRVLAKDTLPLKVTISIDALETLEDLLTQSFSTDINALTFECLKLGIKHLGELTSSELLGNRTLRACVQYYSGLCLAGAITLADTPTSTTLTRSSKKPLEMNPEELSTAKLLKLLSQKDPGIEILEVKQANVGVQTSKKVCLVPSGQTSSEATSE